MDTESFKKKVIVGAIIATLVVMLVPYRIYAADGGYELTSYDKDFIEKWRPLAQELGAEYGIPYRAAMTQWIVESDRGRSFAARSLNNIVGEMIPGTQDKQSFSSQEESVKSYFLNVSGNRIYTSRGSLNYPMNSYGFLSAIAEVYCPEQGYYAQLEPILTAVMDYEEEREAEIAAAEAAEAEKQAEIKAAVEEAKADTTESVLETVEKQIYQEEYNRLMAAPSPTAGATKVLSVMITASHYTDNMMVAMRDQLENDVRESIESNNVYVTAATKTAAQ